MKQRWVQVKQSSSSAKIAFVTAAIVLVAALAVVALALTLGHPW